MNENDWLRVTRYLTGEGSADERRETERWIAASADHAELVRRLRLGWERASQRSEPFDVELAWGEVVRRKTVRASSGVPASPRTPQALFGHIGRSRTRSRWPAMLAASVVLAIGVGVAWRTFGAGRGFSAIAAAGPMRAVTTQPGQIAEVYLSDGTHVRLGAASTLRFPVTFGHTRRVFLEGEGYFDVVHDPAREFTVHTADAVARDVGTRFGVRAYPGSGGTEIVVADGVVALKPARAGTSAGLDSAVLARSDLGRIDAAGGLTVAHRVKVEDYLAWMDGRLVFDHAPLREVLPRLRRWYGIDLRLGDSLSADLRLTATLEAGSLPEALHRLAALLDARVERQGPEGHTIVLFPRRPARE